MFQGSWRFNVDPFDERPSLQRKGKSKAESMEHDMESGLTGLQVFEVMSGF